MSDLQRRAGGLLASLWAAQDECCFLCGEKMFKVSGDAFITNGWTREHLHPRCSTGRGMGNNIVLSHYRCNAERGNRQPSFPETEAARKLYASFGMVAFLEDVSLRIDVGPRRTIRHDPAWSPTLGDMIGDHLMVKDMGKP